MDLIDKQMITGIKLSQGDEDIKTYQIYKLRVSPRYLSYTCRSMDHTNPMAMEFDHIPTEGYVEDNQKPSSSATQSGSKQSKS
jgi:hypothetical protein